RLPGVAGVLAASPDQRGAETGPEPAAADPVAAGAAAVVVLVLPAADRAAGLHPGAGQASDQARRADHRRGPRHLPRAALRPAPAARRVAGHLGLLLAHPGRPVAGV